MARKWTGLGYARRVDVHLRAAFPNLQTRIFETVENRFLIVFDRSQQDASAIAAEFDYAIRFATVAVQVANDAPAEFLREIEPLSDAEASSSFVGLPMPMRSFNTLVTARFPDLSVIGVEEDFETSMFRIVVERAVPPSSALALIEFVDGLELPFRSELQIGASAPKPSPVAVAMDANIMRIAAPRDRPAAPAFVRVDDAFWFENLAAAASGQLPLEKFPGVTDGAYRCFADFSGGQHINLRQALLLYDEVYCSLPLSENHDEFLNRQALTEADLLQMVEKGRLKFLSTQPEERLRLPFLTSVAERCPEAILGRRATSLLLLSDVARTANAYSLRDPRLFPALREFSEVLGPVIGVAPDKQLRAILWPLVAMRRAIDGLMEEGSKRSPAAALAEIMAEIAQNAAQVDIRLEGYVASERVHLGHSLNATVFPPLNEPPGMTAVMAMLGHELNFFSGFNTNIAAAWAANERRRADGVEVLPPIPFLEFDPQIPIWELLEDSGRASTRSQGRALLARLADLPAEARQAEVDALADRLRGRARRKENNLLSLDTLDTGIAVASIMAQFVYPPVMGIAHLGGALIEPLRRLPVVDRMAQILAEDFARSFGSNQDLHFLSKINRVAHLRRPTV